MAQDSNARPVRPDDSYSHEAAAGRNNDPLAELARLIGQDDPFAPKGGQGAPARGTQPQHHHDDHADQADQYDQAAYDAHYGRAHEAQYAHDEQYAHDQQYEQGQYPEEYYEDGQAYSEEGYEEPAAQKRRSGLTIVAALVGLAVVGTAGVYGYRAVTGPSRTAGEPPVIKAEQAPMKVVPPAPTTDPQAPKAYTPGGPDRGGEKVVPREEQPVDPRSFAKVAPPAPPAPPAVSGSSVLPPVAGAPQPQPGAAPGSTEPKKVKTVAIRPDQPQGVPTQPAAPAQPPARMAATPPAASPAPTPARPVAGGHYVQVSSQMNEADALASFKSLQAKYPSQLGDQQPTIRRVDLTDKGIGIRYRTMVGPFSSSSEAKQFCENFKAAGGKCIANPS